MSWVIGTVTLPFPPKKVTDKSPADVKSYTYPGELPLLISMGNKARILSLEGYISAIGKTATQLEEDYLVPLRNMVHTQVTVAAPDSRYDGDYIMVAFSFWEEGGTIRVFRYKIDLWKGHIHVVL